MCLLRVNELFFSKESSAVTVVFYQFFNILLLLSALAFRPGMTSSSASVCTLSAAWAWLGEKLLHTFITRVILMCAGCWSGAADERDVETHTRCVGSQCVFHLTWTWSSSFFCHRFSLFFMWWMFVSLFICSISPSIWLSLVPPALSCVCLPSSRFHFFLVVTYTLFPPLM